MAKCLVCNKKFIPKSNTKGKYCSLYCYWKWKKGKPNPWMVGKISHHWKGGKHRCSHCGDEIVNWYAKSCRKCYLDKPKEYITSEWIKKCLKRRKMSKLETKVQQVINKYHLPYKFVGNGEVIIGRKNPDFVNINGEKKVVEVYWKRHKEQFRDMTVEQWKQKRQISFQKYGWNVIFIEGTNLSEKGILQCLKGGY